MAYVTAIYTSIGLELTVRSIGVLMDKVNVIHQLKLRDLKKAFCNHCLNSGLVNLELSKGDRDVLLQQHWERFWKELNESCSLIPVWVNER